jgi:hypothetical protein
MMCQKNKIAVKLNLNVLRAKICVFNKINIYIHKQKKEKYYEN